MPFNGFSPHLISAPLFAPSLQGLFDFNFGTLVGCTIGMGHTWAKFSTLPAKNHRKFESATGKQTFGFNYQGRTQVKKYVSDDTLINQIHVYPRVIGREQ